MRSVSRLNPAFSRRSASAVEETNFMKYLVKVTAWLLLSAVSGWAAQEISVTGMVLKVDRPLKTFVVSCQSIPGYMAAMTMPFEVRDAKNLDGLAPGMTVVFMLLVDGESSYAERIQIQHYASVEQDPMTARRLKLLTLLAHPDGDSSKSLHVGQTVPNFTLTDQNRRPVTLAQLAGKVIALNFIYTSCALPNFCFRNSNTFGVLQKRFKDQMGEELVLLTVTFDPQRDGPEALAKYAKTWKADPATWHFLTGSVPDIQRVTNMFGMDYFPDEGLMNHSLHTAVIDRQGKLVANIEGNQFTSDQLGDLIGSVLDDHASKGPVGQTRIAHNADQKLTTSR
jgi:protein SCO1/2